MDSFILTKSETAVFDALLQKSGTVCARDDIAQSVWKERWMDKYSDWQIDRLIYLLRRKLPDNYSIKTLRNSGYILLKKGVSIPNLPEPKTDGTAATVSYLEYMNDPTKPRKALADLFAAFGRIHRKINSVLIVNSYSSDNVDAAASYFVKNCTIYFSHFDLRALKIHEEQAEKLYAWNIRVINDDICCSMFKNNAFDLIINDFRLNFNKTDRQNIETMKETRRILSTKGMVLVSVVIDPRDKQNRLQIPWTFIAQEDLRRNCYTALYYRRLFIKTGFRIIMEFDKENGVNWHPPYRRFMLRKALQPRSLGNLRLNELL